MLGSWSSAFLYAYIGIFLLSWVNLITSYKFLCPQFACWMLPPLDAKPISEVFSLKFTYSGEAHKHFITPTYISSSEPYDNLIIFFHIIEWILVFGWFYWFKDNVGVDTFGPKIYVNGSRSFYIWWQEWDIVIFCFGYHLPLLKSWMRNANNSCKQHFAT